MDKEFFLSTLLSKERELVKLEQKVAQHEATIEKLAKEKEELTRKVASLEEKVKDLSATRTAKRIQWESSPLVPISTYLEKTSNQPEEQNKTDEGLSIAGEGNYEETASDPVETQQQFTNLVPYEKALADMHRAQSEQAQQLAADGYSVSLLDPNLLKAMSLQGQFEHYETQKGLLEQAEALRQFMTKKGHHPGRQVQCQDAQKPAEVQKTYETLAERVEKQAAAQVALAKALRKFAEDIHLVAGSAQLWYRVHQSGSASQFEFAGTI